MNRIALPLFSVFALSVVSPGARADRIMVAPVNLTQKILASEIVVSAKVQSLEAETVDLAQYQGATNKVPYTIANLKIETAFFGAKNITHLKVAFQNTPALPFDGGGANTARQLNLSLPVSLSEGQEGVFFLVKHPTSVGHYIVNLGHDPLDAKAKGYKDELAQVKAASAVLRDPEKALAAEKVEERIESALFLARKYRSYPVPSPAKGVDQIPIPEAETKLMLKILIDSDWSKTDAHKVADALGLIPGQYGIPDVLPGDGEDLNAVRSQAFKAWHEKYGAKFAVQKFTPKSK